MLFYIGLFFFIFAIIGTIRLVMAARRPTTKALVTELYLGKLKTDTFKMMPDQLHARVTYVINGVEHSGQIPVLKNMQVKQGDELSISYKAEDPREIMLASHKNNWIMLLVMYLISLALMIGSLIITSFLN